MAWPAEGAEESCSTACPLYTLLVDNRKNVKGCRADVVGRSCSMCIWGACVECALNRGHRASNPFSPPVVGERARWCLATNLPENVSTSSVFKSAGVKAGSCELWHVTV